MPNKHYVNGAALERRIKKHLERAGWFVGRAAGSKDSRKNANTAPTTPPVANASAIVFMRPWRSARGLRLERPCPP